jgi:hypothetical protein
VALSRRCLLLMIIMTRTDNSWVCVLCWAVEWAVDCKMAQCGQEWRG